MAEQAGAGPELTVVIPTDRWETIVPVLDRLSTQPAKPRIELLLLSASPGPLARAAAALEGFGAVRVEAALPAVRAQGVALARGPVVFLGETHSYVGERWAELLLAAHREWDVVVPCFGNANPGTALSWAAFLQDYGWCGEGRPAGELAEWPGLNVSYRRSALLALGDGLDAALQKGDELRGEIRRRGGKACFAPHIRVDHLNVDRRWSWARERFLRGLLIAGHRRAAWGWTRRIGYALAAPLIALVLMGRNWAAFRDALRAGRLPRWTAPAWIAGIAIRAGGEAVGYAFGAGPGSLAEMEEYETHKLAYTRPAP